MLQHGDPHGSVWRPGETDVSIRPGWFHHDAETARVRTSENLVNLFFTSVGRNSKLLLNVPPTRAGLIDGTDAARLAAMHDRLTALFADDLTRGRRWTWHGADGGTAVAEIDLGRDRHVGLADLREDIAQGQWVERFVIETMTGGEWRRVSDGTTIGHRRLARWESLDARRVRITVAGAPKPSTLRLGLFEGGTA
jgi:alpha-L-fucosidase